MSAGTPVRTFRLDQEHWTRLQAHADTHGVTASDAIRDLIDAYTPPTPATLEPAVA